MKLEVGKTYKCGNLIVEVIHFHDHNSLNCLLAYTAKEVGGCRVGMFSSSGHPSTSSVLGWQLREIISQEKQNKLDKIASMEKDLAALKAEVEKEQ